MLENTSNSKKLTSYSADLPLNPNDHIIIPHDIRKRNFDDIILDSSSKLLGNLGDFTLDFKVSILKNGNFSFLAPRVVLDSGKEQYYIIIHDNGLLELALMANGSFKSALATSFVGYKLNDPNASINLRVTRNFDEV
jgi:hypothetical protein